MATRSPRIGTVALRRAEPRVVASFTDRTSPAKLRAAVRRGLSFLEARVDLFESFDAAHVVDCVRRVRAVAPVLATVRSSAEGGKWRRSESSRLALYRSLLPHVDAIDVELEAPIRRSVVRAARAIRRTVVLSHHDFEETPPAARLDDIVARGAKAGADVVKIAALVRNADDLVTLAALFDRHRSRPLVVIGMGPQGRLTRVLFPAFGSLFTFASLERKTAPGQLGLDETIAELRKYLATER